MITKRLKSIEKLLERNIREFQQEEKKISEIYGSQVFNEMVMRSYLSRDAYKKLRNIIEHGGQIDKELADVVASAMKDWAISKGATHYTHWFQPLNGLTAEKHDAFFEPTAEGLAIETFDGDKLTQQEPDASSFPSGGIRNTFEARGYTAWDPTSPAFILGGTLCIPTIFVSYTGEALDYKTPLLRSLHAIDKAATEVCQYFDKNITKVYPTLGWEQEYFLIDKAFYYSRPDIMLTGRALIGYGPAKGQQLEDHYFGSIPSRVSAFMRELEYEAHRLGIPIKTRHNEVAPNQFECAPIYEEVNLAVDHNQLLMDLMPRVAAKHNFVVLLHEKPFKGLNGSGKHNNWSLATNTGVNLLSPGKNPKGNLQFLTFFINTIKAIHDNADILRASIASASNDHRLGANEAPPAIISVFIGSYLTGLLDDLEQSVKTGKMTPEEKTVLKLNIGKIPQILRDNTDRNRTSPFAFTGNKFEFRAVGSSANCASAMTVLNSIVANQLIEFKANVDKLIAKGLSKDEAIFNELKRCIKVSKKIRFEGNGYSEEWVKEAKKRGLSNIKDTPRALDIFDKKETKKLFSDLGVLTEKELEARHEIELDKYTLKVQIESRVLGDIVLTHIIPSALKYQNELIKNLEGLYNVYGKKADELTMTTKKLIEEISNHINKLYQLTESMVDARKKANKIESSREKAIAYCDEVLPHFDQIKYHCDKLELLVDDNLWPMPKMKEILFTR